MNTYYHGTPTGDIKVLKPNLSNHDKKYVYLSKSEVVAYFYMAKSNFYTYGFEKGTNIPEYTEYYPDALKETYLGKRGFLYRCNTDLELHNPTNIWCAFVTEKEVTTDSVEVVEDVYKKLLEFENQGKLKISRYNKLSNEQSDFINKQIKNIIISEDLFNRDIEYSKFIKSKFPILWEEALTEAVTN